MQLDRLTINRRRRLHHAQRIAQQHRHTEMEVEHLMLAAGTRTTGHSSHAPTTRRLPPASHSNSIEDALGPNWPLPSSRRPMAPGLRALRQFSTRAFELPKK